MLCHRFTLICALGISPLSVAAQAASDSGAATPVAAPVPSVSAASPPANPAERPAWLKARLDAIFASPALAGAKISVLVLDAESGKPIYGRNEKNGLNAASNVKLVTSAAALALLGPEFRWKTAVLGLAPAEGGRAVSPAGELQGDLLLRASGDPTLTAHDLAELASEISAIGLRRVRGGLLIDATAFDSATVGPSYDEKDDSAAFRAPSSAASLNSNAVSVIITPGPSAGAAARVVLDPPSSNLVLAGRVTTASKGPAAPIVQTSDAGKGQTRVTVSGRILLGSEPRIVLRRIVQPDLFLGQTFKQILQKRGITIDQPLRVAAAPKNGLRTLATHDSPTLAVVVHELGKRSNNFVAEQVLRTLGGEVMGKPGTWQKGLDAVARYLEGLGIAKASFSMHNGSGLYDSNRFSAEQIATVIRAAMRDFRISGEFLASLAVSGADGTLANRMTGSAAERYVRAKTGTLAKVSCLSGVAGAPGQKPLVFSFLMNDVRSPVEARALQDQATELLVGFLDPTLLEKR
ncbi:MAG TPA: D-alanyl-D-alanine carboxypeptidase/D-alanyl-D-alanine-endopeptidase [Polyangia bacterium]|jgi:D-alanyl-D-alanine carboxypeptidase, serine-type, PBP4 family|nr:D-alanyl-D-alanine carboxypeptidase/D-alanyl-D-alanine-endopeptidase [Polyangia bacterium]